jgi:hypothetical protein
VRSLLASLLVAAIAGAGLLALQPSPASATPAVIGIGEQNVGMFANKNYTRLKVHDVRYITPWDTLEDPYQLSLLDTYLQAARTSHQRVLLSFVHSQRTEKLAKTLPSVAQFRKEFKAVRERYPWIRDFIPWNEANHPDALTYKNPKRAAQYYDVVAQNCHGCNVVAADVLDVSTMVPWLKKFKRGVTIKPKIWGLHNYGDANGLKDRGTARLLANVKGQIWFTETGGLVLRRQYVGNKPVKTYRYTLAHAAKATKHVLELACTSPRIRRVYLYDWQAPRTVTSWDSSFLNPKGVLRPAYAVLRRWVRSSQGATHKTITKSTCRARG